MTKDITNNIVKGDIRLDLKIISEFVRPKSKVLDIGCGDGELLEFLRREKNVDGRGLELSHLQISKAMSRGLSVIQGNAETDLSFYPNSSFDFAILSQTIQAMHNPKEILEEMLRIAEYAVVSLPNFGHIRNRTHLALKGIMPVNKAIPFEWYDTPNIHFCSIKDFRNLCSKLGFAIEKEIYITGKSKLTNFFGMKFANLFAEYGIFLITKKDFAVAGQEEFIFQKQSKSSLVPSLAFEKKD